MSRETGLGVATGYARCRSWTVRAGAESSGRGKSRSCGGVEKKIEEMCKDVRITESGVGDDVAPPFVTGVNVSAGGESSLDIARVCGGHRMK